MNQTLDLILLVLTVMPMLMMGICLCLMGTISGKHFDRKLKENKCSLPWTIASDYCVTKLCGRTTMYLFLVLTNSNRWLTSTKSKNKYILRLKSNHLLRYHDADYRSFARKRDWVMAIMYWGSLCIWVLTLLVMMCLPD
jgi:hypothetical protein